MSCDVSQALRHNKHRHILGITSNTYFIGRILRILLHLQETSGKSKLTLIIAISSLKESTDGENVESRIEHVSFKKANINYVGSDLEPFSVFLFSPEISTHRNLNCVFTFPGNIILLQYFSSRE